MIMSVLQKNLPKFEEISHPLGTLYWRGRSNLSLPAILKALEVGEFPHGIRGNFAFIWIGQHDWIAAVDHLASIPLFFTKDAISNLYSDLLETLPTKEENNAIEYQIKFLGGQSFYSDETSFKGIRRVMPGQYVKNSISHPYIDYWSYEEDQFCDRARFGQLMETAVEQDIGQKNILLLSGGTDSTALGGILKKLNKTKSFRFVHAHSSLQQFSEKESVEKISKDMDLPIEYREIYFSGDIDPEISRRQFSFWIENPFPGKRKAIEALVDETTKIFTGEIGDQLFGGPKNPALLKYAIQAKEISPIELAKMWVNLSDSYGRECGILPSKRIQVMFEMDPLARTVYEQLVAYIASQFELMKSKDFLNRIMMLNYLIKGPYRVWAYSQDTFQWCHPLASWEVFDFSFRVSSNNKVRDEGVQKWILFDQWKEFLSPVPWRSKKNGFGIPTKNKFKDLPRNGALGSVRSGSEPGGSGSLSRKDLSS